MFLRKRNYAPHWIACWKDGDRTIERSTKQTNKHKAAKLMARWAGEIEKSFYKDIKKITFGELAKRWIKNQEPNIKVRTKASYEDALNRLLPFFEYRIVRDIRPEHVDQWKGKLAEELSPRSVNIALWALRAILDFALRLGYCHTNAAKLVKGMKKPSMERQALSIEQLHILLNAAEGQGKILLMFASLVGCRLGECLAVRWKNLDWEEQTLEVKESYSSFGLDTPKTKSSLRTVNLPQVLVEKLKEHKVQQNALRLKSGGSWGDQGLIFTSPTGNYLDQGNVRRWFYKAIQKANEAIEEENQALKAAGKNEIAKLYHFRFHDLRGVACTLMLESGASLKHVMDQLGHSTPAMTLGIYAGVTQEGKKQAQERLQQYVFG